MECLLKNMPRQYPQKKMPQLCHSFSSPLFICLLTLALAVSGCRTGSKTKTAERSSDDSTNIVLTPNLKPVGRIAHVNKPGRFVVVNYTLGPIPRPDQRIFAYRNGLRIAELRVTGPEEDTNTVADILAGDPQIQDEVRED